MHPIENYLRDLEAAVEAKLYFVALSTALTLPEICAAMEHKDGEGTTSRYIKWYDENCAYICPHLKGVDCHKMRCGIVHQGRSTHRGSTFDRIIFSTSGFSHGNVVRSEDFKLLQLNINTFCAQIVECVRDWYGAKAEDPVVKGNAELLLQWGKAPYFGFVQGDVIS